MDQDSFRKLLDSKSKATTSKTPIYGAPTGTKSKHKTVDASQPAFQPRKVKKDAKPGYRDRASERRGGQGNDYAQVEAVLEDFERRNADNADKDTVEQQRKYLGGDSDHSILVKGLDFALLEQNKARAALSTEDDDSLEAAFAESTIDVPAPTSQGDSAGGSKKRTRADILRELKEKQHAGAGATEGGSASIVPVDEVKKLEEAKKAGKFKPIGFTPIGKTDEKTKKKKKTEKEGKDEERKKKRRKVEEKSSEVTAQVKLDVTTEKSKTVEEVPAPSIPKPKEPAPEPDVEFDIFEGAGDYEIDLGDDEGDEEEEASPSKPEDGEASPIRTGGWFADADAQPSTSQRPKSPTPPPPPRQADELAEEGEMEEDQPIRLEALESSALPSIKDFLAMDEAAGKEKRRKRKEKKKAGGGGGGGGEGGSKMTAEAKADRDYQRLKSYQAKSS